MNERLDGDLLKFCIDELYSLDKALDAAETKHEGIREDLDRKDKELMVHLHQTVQCFVSRVVGFIVDHNANNPQKH